MNNEQNHPPVSPVAKSVRSSVAVVAIGLVVCQSTYVLRELNFPPLQALIAFEDSVYDFFMPPKLELSDSFHSIIFIDIDDAAINKWKGVDPHVAGTPRRLLAELTRVARDANAAAVFLDFDFRNALSDDRSLVDELARPSSVRVFLPRFLASAPSYDCKRQADQDAPIELPNIFDEAIAGGAVSPVHSIASTGAYGVVDGACSYYRVRTGPTLQNVDRKAAMAAMVDWARGPEGTGTWPQGPSRLLPIRWRISGDTQQLRDDRDRLAFARIKAEFFIRGDTISTSGLDLTALRNAIVIIGSTHRWAADSHDTPLGLIPGALVQANLGVAIQTRDEADAPLWLQFGVDVVLLLATGVCTVFLWRFGAYRGARPPNGVGVVESMAWLLAECLVIIAAGIAFGSAVLIIARLSGGFLAGWRFGMLSFALAAILVLLIEITAFVAEKSGEWAAEAWRKRIEARRSRTTPSPSPELGGGTR